jgi:hypothetical protein
MLWHIVFPMIAFPAVLALLSALSALFPKATVSSLSMQKLVSNAVLANPYVL